ncbi:MAG: hypothetical protein COC19_02245 [SAR86 cluster bacterium]|uniref:Sigma D regulator n=1 Tax=SAR86 cluster bacterium TaxID=2030880 RepID=A0A2A4MSI6_9GAMM|nr:MAG: hypothetical protein COC19_02245 [SAR86 cluster bacterium]
MFTGSTKTKQGWHLVDEMVKRWMQQRIELTHDFETLVSPKFEGDQSKYLADALSAFNQTLVDYVSAGHFEIYNELINEAREYNDGSLSNGIDLCKSIEHSTDLALAFNDKYAASAELVLERLPRDITELGNMLNRRFELEDQLIQAAHSCHRAKVA